jgi:hypothetical protein
VTGERKTRQETQPSLENQYNNNNDVLVYEAPEPSVTVQETPSLCATCAEVRPLIDEALDQLRRLVLVNQTKPYEACAQALLAMRDLVAQHQDADGEEVDVDA